MWISDQNNRMMYNSNHLKTIGTFISGIYDYCIFVTENDKDNNSIIGSYGTEDKMIKVYEMIQQAINTKKCDKVFQVPADEEVWDE